MKVTVVSTREPVSPAAATVLVALPTTRDCVVSYDIFADRAVTDTIFQGLLVTTSVFQTLAAVERDAFAHTVHTATYQSNISSIVALEPVITDTAPHPASDIE